MFEDYKATDKDFRAIEEGIKIVWNPKLNFVFKRKKFIENVIVVSYDCENIYLWSKTKYLELDSIECNLNQYFSYKIPHKLRIFDKYQYAWWSGLKIKKLIKLILLKLKTDEMITPFINGALLTPFTTLQKKKKTLKNNPYTTLESYLATIVHEFGHVYWHQHKLWYYSDKKANLRLLETAKELYKMSGNLPDSKKKALVKTPLRFPSVDGMTELFAFCVEYQASLIFWPIHKRNSDLYAINLIEYLIKIEKTLNLEKQDSMLEPRKYPHDFAFVFSKIILTLYPKTWPRLLVAPTPNIMHIHLN